MAYVRAVLRLALFATVTVGSYLALVVIMPLRRSNRLHLPLRNRIYRTWARTLGRVAGMRVRCEGTPPRGAFFLVVNHVSYMDVMLIASHVDAAFVAKADLRAWPILGHIFSSADTIFINRERRRDVVRVSQLLDGALARGLGVLVFPEGTATRGAEIRRFKTSLLQLPAERGLPVSYATIHYRTPAGCPPAHQVVCWWGDAPFLPHIWKLMQLPFFEAVLRFGDEPIHHPDRKELARRLRAAMRERFEPIP
ncbi:MAG: 1-acyl-sn-glycerol-3-phosphate acyltransferase [Acidobacteria bacterium]|nr:MAG: 1-acyl-sn-glycerol-3-phosphate acyltransferase [Acidobacteriota bacterium]